VSSSECLGKACVLACWPEMLLELQSFSPCRADSDCVSSFPMVLPPNPSNPLPWESAIIFSLGLAPSLAILAVCCSTLFSCSPVLLAWATSVDKQLARSIFPNISSCSCCSLDAMLDPMLSLPSQADAPLCLE